MEGVLGEWGWKFGLGLGIVVVMAAIGCDKSEDMRGDVDKGVRISRLREVSKGWRFLDEGLFD